MDIDSTIADKEFEFTRVANMLYAVGGPKTSLRKFRVRIRTDIITYPAELAIIRAAPIAKAFHLLRLVSKIIEMRDSIDDISNCKKHAIHASP